MYATETQQPHIHRAPWPGSNDFAGIAAPDNAASFDLAMACYNAINKAKSEAGVSAGRVVEKLTLKANAATLAALAPVLSDVTGAARCQAHATAEERGSRDVSINLRASRQQRSLIDRAAAAVGKSRSDFMLEAARREAESVLLDRRYFALGAESFDAFLERLDAPPKADARLRRLLRERAPWDR